MVSRVLMAIGIRNGLAKYNPLTTKKIKIMTKTLLESVGEELYIGQLLVSSLNKTQKIMFDDFIQNLNINVGSNELKRFFTEVFARLI
jgi:hypothetical protein